MLEPARPCCTTPSFDPGALVWISFPHTPHALLMNTCDTLRAGGIGQGPEDRPISLEDTRVGFVNRIPTFSAFNLLAFNVQRSDTLADHHHESEMNSPRRYPRSSQLLASVQYLPKPSPSRNPHLYLPAAWPPLLKHCTHFRLLEAARHCGGSVLSIRISPRCVSALIHEATSRSFGKCFL
ncbi:hypothetical protein NP233_g8189 [Leucocoprinus birnbaumii]|uniref:Uncharacterized protein n=1 Tax=Leucocoprinus birnbaumii TaxID=56174 RepID=A0AAD5VMT1_9AGAR|nr:hypothetical protein NP233_g8189 [Leucocoprinus birnbaumii]